MRIMLALIFLLATDCRLSAEPPLDLDCTAASLAHTIRCPICQGQTVADSNALLARAIHASIRAQLEKGVSPSAIKKALAQQYGDRILLEPPFKPATYLLWALPWIVVVSGLLMAMRRTKRRQ